MVEKIVSIKSVEDFEDEYDGYVVETTCQTIRILVSNFQDCCESWGYISSDDDLNKFIGAKLLFIRVTTDELNTHIVWSNENNEPFVDCGGMMFITFATSRGMFQLAVYNGHNGYYSHEAIVRSQSVNVDTVL